MKTTPKERLYDKSRKMIDLIYDEVLDDGEKQIDASFIDRNHKKYQISVGIKVGDDKEEENISEPTPETDLTDNASTDLTSDEGNDLVNNENQN